MRLLLLTACALSLVSCSPPASDPGKQTQAAPPAPVPKPADESHRFPKRNLVSTRVVDSALLAKPFMPGGTLAEYRRGATKYQMFVARAASAADAATKLSDWRSALASPEFVASFGGYYGKDPAGPVFVFVKGEWIAGVVGLSRRDADAASRVLAAEL